MSDKKKKDETAEEGEAPAKKKRSKKVLVPIVVLIAGLLGGGYFMTAGASAKVPAHPAPGGTTTSTTAALGAIVKLDSITLNLADGRYLKVGIALQLSKKGDPVKMVTDSAKALDVAISVLGAKTYAQLSAPGGRDTAKAELSAKVVKVYAGTVLGVYFTEFVMQ
jgi:flagellar protein FliL